MANEPAGQSKKLHPLFTTSKTDRDEQQGDYRGGGEQTATTAPWPYPTPSLLVEQADRGPGMDPGGVFRPEGELQWPMPTQLELPTFLGSMSSLHRRLPTLHGNMRTVPGDVSTPIGSMPRHLQDMQTLHGNVPTVPGATPTIPGPTQTLPEHMPILPEPTQTHLETMPTGTGTSKTTSFGTVQTVLGSIPIVPGPISTDRYMNLFIETREAARATEATAAGMPQNSTTPVPQPKRRGRPPKKRKAEAAGDITSHFSRSSGQSNEENSGHYVGAMLPPLEPAPPLPFPLGPHPKGSVFPSPWASAACTAPPVGGGAPTEDQDPSVKRPKYDPKTVAYGSLPRLTKETSVSTEEGGSTAAQYRQIVVRYGQESPTARVRIGVLIEAILSSKCRVFPPREPTKETSRSERSAGDKSTSAASASTPKESAGGPQSKSTHPFFTTAFQKTINASASSAPASSNFVNGTGTAILHTATPFSPPRGPPRGFQPSSSLHTPQLGANNGILRVPGARFPAWPWKGAVHVRPDEDSAVPEAQKVEIPPTRSPKRKGNAVEVHCDESIVARLVERLSVASVLEEIRQQSGDDYIVQKDLRLPQRHVESGRKLQARLAPRLRTSHPSIATLFASLEKRLSAYDQFGCEQLSWAQKYSPCCATEVLQGGQEPYMLKSWLEALKVVSVDTGPGDAGTPASGNAKGAGGYGKGTLRKRRKKAKLDGFIVSSDEENDELGEVSDAEADWSAGGGHGLRKRTVVRGSDLFDKAGRVHARPMNAVVLSGPHGCGKSAAVYAVAKELGFEVFEISANSRRSGKDVLDKIGDMTRNHLVQHRKQKPAVPSSAPEGEPDDSFGMDSDNDDGGTEGATASKSGGRQATMSAFFKPKAQPTQLAKRGRKPKAAGETTPHVAAKTTLPQQDKKQSVILLEEADILYEEDKQFWATVMGLIAQSKRPFVITCNDETLIPLHALRLHGIFRFAPPPVDAAVDRLLVVAACENHVLERSAVQALYEARGYDFRAALMDLQFWCQMAVGDQRGGMDWFVQRWPVGCDVDEEGQVKRAVSEDTYREGMGWLRHDDMGNRGSAADGVDAESDLLLQAWTGWQVDMGQWQDSLDLGTWANQLLKEPGAKAASDRKKRLAQLALYEGFAEDMSDADVVSCRQFASRNAVPLDATQPELSSKAQDDYVLGLQLLDQTAAAHGNDTLRFSTATAMRCAAKQQLRAGIEAQTWDDESRSMQRLDALQEAQVVASIRAYRAQKVPSQAPAVSRVDFSLAFDPIATVDGSGGLSSSSVEASVFDRNLEPIAVDVAPFVRGIVAYEGRLQKQRRRLNTFLSETPLAGSPSVGLGADGDSSDGVASEAAASRRQPKRMRTTRAALSALEGGSRSTTRKERWFQADVNPVLVMRTGGDGWEAVAEAFLAEAAAAAAADGNAVDKETSTIAGPVAEGPGGHEDR